MKKSIIENSPFFLLLIMMLLLLTHSQYIAGAIMESLQFCARSIIPALFPYLVLSGLFAELPCRVLAPLNRALKLNGDGTQALVLGFLAGFPCGAKCIATQYANNRISKEDAERLLFFSCNAGPAFVIGVVGIGLYHSMAIGIAFYAIQLLSAILCALLLRRRSVKAEPFISSTHKATAGTLCVRAITDAGHTMLTICAFICIFAVLQALLLLIAPKSHLLRILCAFLEISNGSSLLMTLPIPWLLKFLITAAMVCSSGLCVLMQTAAILAPSELPLRPYIHGKLLQSVFSLVIAWPLSYLFAPIVNAGNFPVVLRPLSPWPWSLLSATILFIVFHKISSSNSALSEL